MKEFKTFLKTSLSDAFWLACEEAESKDAEFPWWMPYWMRRNPEYLVGVAHGIALVSLIYALAWTCLAYVRKEVPGYLGWKPMGLIKLGYPMIPVILGCWITRGRRDAKMTLGYYFANLKSALLPSLGPGFLIGFLLDKVIVRPRQVLHEAELWCEFLLPMAWILGCSLWALIATPTKRWWPAEARRSDWGLYQRIYLDYKPEKPWKEWIVKGPQTIFGAIAAPEHGTYHKVAVASWFLAAGITICCLIMWFFLILWWALLMPLGFKSWWYAEVKVSSGLTGFGALIETDFPNLVLNTLTAPVLIWYTWRSEPKENATAAHARSQRDSFSRAYSIVVDDRQVPLVIFYQDHKKECEDLFEAFVNIVAQSRLEHLAGDEELGDLLLSAGARGSKDPPTEVDISKSQITTAT